jgi:sodium transport system permease protein
MMQVLMVQQLVTIACPALFMAILLTKSVSNTLRLRLPNGKVLAAALVLPLALQPLSQELAHQLHWFFPPLPKAIQDLAGAMADSNQPLWLVLLAFAATPAICEEVAFRGFILSGFSRSRHAWLAIVLSSLAFGAMHMIPQQVFNASLVGLVLGLIAFRGKSLIPCVLFHFCYNALGVMSTRVTAQPEWLMFPSADWFLTVGESGLRFGWVTLLLAALTATLLITWLVKHGRKSPHADEPTNPHADEFADEKAPAQPSVRI